MMIELKSIRKSFKNNIILNDISMRFNDKELVIVTGESGCGKTTLLNIISGIEKPDNGEVIINGEKEIQNDCVNEKISYLCQKQILLYDRTVYENIYSVLKINNFCGNYEEKVVEILNEVNLNEELLNSKAKNLSTGERQRLLIGIAIAKNSSILLLDEATESLDYENAYIIYELLKKISKTKTVLLVTHDVSNASKYADRLLLISNGSMTEKSTTKVNNNEMIEKNRGKGIAIKKQKIRLKFDYLYLFFLLYSILFILIIGNINARKNPKNIMHYPNYLYTSKEKLSGEDIKTILKDKSYDLTIDFNIFNCFVDYTDNYDTIKIIEGKNIENNNDILVSKKMHMYNTESYSIGKTIKKESLEYKIVGIFDSNYNVILLDKERNNHLLEEQYGADYVFRAIEDEYYYQNRYFSYEKEKINGIDLKINDLVLQDFLSNYKVELDVCLYIPIILFALTFILNIVIVMFYVGINDYEILFYRVNGIKKKKIRKLFANKLYFFPIALATIFNIFAYLFLYFILTNQKCYRVDSIVFAFSFACIGFCIVTNEIKNILLINNSIKKMLKK